METRGRDGEAPERRGDNAELEHTWFGAVQVPILIRTQPALQALALDGRSADDHVQFIGPVHWLVCIGWFDASKL